MTSIDWSKAPEDATHYGSKFDEQRMIVCWYRDRGIDGMDYWYSTAGELDGRGWEPLRNPPGHWPLIPRPASTVVWDGQGLPPVGVECLFTAEDEGDGWSEELKPGTKVRVIAHFATTDSVQAAAFTFFSPRLNYHLVEQAIAGCFKPLPTAEQIAAEERKKTIQEMLDVDQCGTLSRTKFCNLLYDAGYRKLPSA